MAYAPPHARNAALRVGAGSSDVADIVHCPIIAMFSSSVKHFLELLHYPTEKQMTSTTGWSWLWVAMAQRRR
jgi:hypothetical protein